MSSVERTIYTTSGPGVHEDVSPAGALLTAFEHAHSARLVVPGNYDQIIGPTVVEPGVRVTYARDPHGQQEEKPLRIEFDAEQFSEAQARAWLEKQGHRDYSFQPDERTKPPQTQGSAADPDERPPAGFKDIELFYAATQPVEGDGQRSMAAGGDDVTRKDDGEWITINGTHVCIDKTGGITKGPDTLVGKKPADLGKSDKPMHAVPLPKDPKRMNISHAEAALSAMGYRLDTSHSKGYDPSTGRTSYAVHDPHGNTHHMDSKDLRGLVYAGAKNYAQAKGTKP